MRSSSNCAVSNDSSKPTSASVIEYGKITSSMSKFHGTSGRPGTGKRSGQVAHVADRGEPEIEHDRADCEEHDGNQRRRNDRRQSWQAVDDGEAHSDEQQVQPELARVGVVTVEQDVRHLCEKDQDRQRIHEPGHHRTRDEPHEFTDAEVAETHLE